MKRIEGKKQQQVECQSAIPSFCYLISVCQLRNYLGFLQIFIVHYSFIHVHRLFPFVRIPAGSLCPAAVGEAIIYPEGKPDAVRDLPAVGGTQPVDATPLLYIRPEDGLPAPVLSSPRPGAGDVHRAVALFLCVAVVRSFTPHHGPAVCQACPPGSACAGLWQKPFRLPGRTETGEKDGQKHRSPHPVDNSTGIEISSCFMGNSNFLRLHNALYFPGSTLFRHFPSPVFHIITS
ncbi:hypothetical protein [Microbacter margulisiae]|uniref:Uncharacterized protein n=1 Tax=Microbacter margulisiae TaxID=1350067 RepID=A0A7W5DN57_9PORP|nr:hypothetical protein [Microbacter margulisiae]MBB3185921.1 hypothetical protein [Microbacter margulisiae]